MKKSVFLTIALTLTVLTSSFASNYSEKKSGKFKKENKEQSALSEAEISFFAELDNYYYETFEKPAEELTICRKKKRRVVVYNMKGNVVTTEQEKVPANADILMREGDTVYYIVY